MRVKENRQAKVGSETTNAPFQPLSHAFTTKSQKSLKSQTNEHDQLILSVFGVLSTLPLPCGMALLRFYDNDSPWYHPVAC